MKDEAVMRLVSDTGIKDIQAQIYFLRELKTLVRNIPLKVYDSPETRENLINGVQEALDRTIDIEEEALE